jgi:hydroxymethylglutaryl-CoA reductase
MKAILGFSRLSKQQKMEIVSQLTSSPSTFKNDFLTFNHPDASIQEKLDSFSENTLTNFPLPYGVVPNVLINNKLYMVPVVIEESSVVAAAAAAAGFWKNNGGFRAKLINSVKNGQVHFIWNKENQLLFDHFDSIKNHILKSLDPLTLNMRARGGGIKSIELINRTEDLAGYFQLFFKFDTVDSMGANFINSCLEEAARQLEEYVHEKMGIDNGGIEILMSILSNYTPECTLRVELSCSFDDLNSLDENLSGKEFAEKFKKAVYLAEIDTFRAVTHNKGIFNGIDAVVLATGNDFRAIEAGAHAYASKDGKYKSLSHVYLGENEFHFFLELPLALGTVGGLTSLHPIAKWSFDILGNPDAEELMMIVASIGLASNFSAVKSLITKGIQSGHMKMHLSNMLISLNVTKYEKDLAINHFANKVVSFSNLTDFINELRKSNVEGK